jgi:glycine/D-amino acid oxidase-like deaminating enzyme
MRDRSLWLAQAIGEQPDQPPLEGETRADVCIIGGGFVGLWTAYWIKRWDPSCGVVLLERDVCGDGASGRNGGFVLSWWAKFPTLARQLGTEDAVEICRRSQDCIDQIARFCAEHGIDADVSRGGWLWTRAHPGADRCLGTHGGGVPTACTRNIRSFGAR